MNHTSATNRRPSRRRLIKRIALLTLAVVPLLLVAAVSFAQTPANRNAIQNQIVANEKAIMDAIGKNDSKAFHTYDWS